MNVSQILGIFFQELDSQPLNTPDRWIMKHISCFSVPIFGCHPLSQGSLSTRVVSLFMIPEEVNEDLCWERLSWLAGQRPTDDIECCPPLSCWRCVLVPAAGRLEIPTESEARSAVRWILECRGNRSFSSFLDWAKSQPELQSADPSSRLEWCGRYRSPLGPNFLHKSCSTKPPTHGIHG